jgi:hypothetical protein
VIGLGFDRRCNGDVGAGTGTGSLAVVGLYVFSFFDPSFFCLSLPSIPADTSARTLSGSPLPFLSPSFDDESSSPYFFFPSIVFLLSSVSDLTFFLDGAAAGAGGRKSFLCCASMYMLPPGDLGSIPNSPGLTNGRRAGDLILLGGGYI